MIFGGSLIAMEAKELSKLVEVKNISDLMNDYMLCANKIEQTALTADLLDVFCEEKQKLISLQKILQERYKLFSKKTPIKASIVDMRV